MYLLYLINFKITIVKFKLLSAQIVWWFISDRNTLIVFTYILYIRKYQDSGITHELVIQITFVVTID